MAEVLRLPSRMLQQCPVTDEVETPLHCSVCPTISTDETSGKDRPRYLQVVDQRDIQQIVTFKDQVEDEIEVRKAGPTRKACLSLNCILREGRGHCI